MASYFGLSEGIKEGDEALILRNLSFDLFDLYKEQPESFKIEDKVSDVVIFDCKNEVM